MDSLVSGNQMRILEKLLRVLVDTWGHDPVAQCLNRLEDDQFRRPGPNEDSARRKRGQRRSALKFLEKIDLPVRKKNALLELAHRYDNRTFLPTIGDIRDFLERRNVRIQPTRGRDSAIPLVIGALLEVPDDNLERILIDDSYSGPSRLGPLSDAIKTAGQSRRSDRDRSD